MKEDNKLKIHKHNNPISKTIGVIGFVVGILFSFILEIDVAIIAILTFIIGFFWGRLK